MGVEFLEPDQYNKWDKFVDISPQGAIFCYSWWLEAITKSNFKIVACIENGKIVAGMPLAFDANNKVNLPPLTRTLGALYCENEYKTIRKQISTERKWLSELLKNLPLEDFVQTCMHHNFTDWLPFRWNGFRQTTRYTYIINYNGKSTEDLWLNLELETRRVIRKATESGIKVETSDDFDLVYQNETMSFKRQGLDFRIPYSDLKLLDKAINQRASRTIFKATDANDNVQAALYVASNKKSAYALLSGSDPDLRKLGGHTLIMWEAIKYFSDKVGYFNFGGSDIEPIESHLRGFGGTLTPYFHIFNENLMLERIGLKYHLRELLFHLKAILKTIYNKMLSSFQQN